MRIKNLFIFASVKIKVYILVAILAAALTYSLDCCVHQMRDITAVSGTADCGSLTDANSAPDKYVEFNCAFCAPGSANIVAQRTNSSSGIPRNINIGKRCPETDNPFITMQGKHADRSNQKQQCTKYLLTSQPTNHQVVSFVT